MSKLFTIINTLLRTITCPFIYKILIKTIETAVLTDKKYKKERFFFFSDLFHLIITLILNFNLFYLDILKTCRNYQYLLKTLIYVFITRFIVRIIMCEILPECRHYNEDVEAECVEDVFSISLFIPLVASMFFKLNLYGWLKKLVFKSKGVLGREDRAIRESFHIRTCNSSSSLNSFNERIGCENIRISHDTNLNVNYTIYNESDGNKNETSFPNMENNLYTETKEISNENIEPENLNNNIEPENLIENIENERLDDVEPANSDNIEPENIIRLIFYRKDYISAFKIICILILVFLFYIGYIYFYGAYIHCLCCQSIDTIIFLLFSEISDSYFMVFSIEFIQNLLFLLNIIDKNCCDKK